MARSYSDRFFVDSVVANDSTPVPLTNGEPDHMIFAISIKAKTRNRGVIDIGGPDIAIGLTDGLAAGANLDMEWNEPAKLSSIYMVTKRGGNGCDIRVIHG